MRNDQTRMPETNLPTCVECGFELGPNAKFCGACGAKVQMHKSSWWTSWFQPTRGAYSAINEESNCCRCRCCGLLFLISSITVNIFGLLAYNATLGGRTISIVRGDAVNPQRSETWSKSNITRGAEQNQPWSAEKGRLVPKEEAPQLPPATHDCPVWERAHEAAQMCASDSEGSTLARCSKFIDALSDSSVGGTSVFENNQAEWESEGDEVEKSQDVAPVYSCIHGTNRELLVGPFHSRVQTWHTLKINHPGLLRTGDRILQFAAHAVYADDAETAVGYPPLHMHHIHVYYKMSIHGFETHGDYLDANRSGGPDYSLSSPPAGTCFALDADLPVKVFAQFNDIRFSSGTGMASEAAGLSSEYRRASLKALRARAPGYAWYFRIAFKLEGSATDASGQPVITATAMSAAPAAPAVPASPCTPVHKLIVQFPLDEHSESDYLQRYDVGHRETLFTWPVTLMRSGQVVPPAWFHSHRARHAGYILVRGNHTLGSLLFGANASARDYESLLSSLPRDGTPRSAALRTKVLEAAQRSRETLLCHDDDSSSPSHVTIEERGDGQGGTFDRQGHTTCRPFAFRAGETVTAFSFSRPVWAADLKIFPQHTMLFFYFIPAESPPYGEAVGIAVPEQYTVIDLNRALPDARALRCRCSLLKAYGELAALQGKSLGDFFAGTTTKQGRTLNWRQPLDSHNRCQALWRMAV